jgi:predicted Zn-dependent protease
MKNITSALVTALLLAACATNPVTGRKEISLVSEGQEIQMGQEAAQQVESSLGLVDDAELQAYVRRVGNKLAAASQRPQLPWRFGVIDDPTPNAFALPGGPIYITRGLMSLMDSEAELATVLGHEIGHVTARHTASQITKSQLYQIAAVGAMIAAPGLQNFGGLLSSGLQLLFLKYSRDNERQADELGFAYALGQNYDVVEMADVFRSLQRVGEVEGKSGIPSWMSTHPDPGERVQTAQKRVAALPAPPAPRVTGRVEYFSQINNLIYGENPRQGFFRGGEFLHPDLRFRMNFPTGWKTQNSPQAVTAVSPNQDAAVQMTLAQGSPQQAAQRFFSQQGLQAGQTSNNSINGNPAFTGYFQAQTEQGTVQGIASFIAYGGNTYQIIGYSSAQRFGSYDQSFRGTIGSFATLTDQSALNVRPNRLTVVRTSAPMTLSEFNSRYPSVIPLRELAIINQVEENSRIPAGTEVKRVVVQ